MRAETKYRGSLKLAAIGDALGWMTEFETSKDTIRKKFGSEAISTFYDWEKTVGGRFNGYVDKIEAGSYSDDTQLLLSVARSIGPDGHVDQEYFAKKELPEWILYSRGAGRTVKNAARKIERKSAKWNRNFFTFKAGKTTIDYRESGANGAAMRILPIALANFGEPDKINEEIFGNSIITHGHPRAILGAMLYGFSINTILQLNPDNFNSRSFLTELGKDMQQKFSVDFLCSDNFSSWEAEWNKGSSIPFRDLFNEVIEETQESLRTSYKLLMNSASDFEALTALGCYSSATKGSGTSTVIAGIFFTCKYSRDPLMGIEQAVNSIGTDTDSIAAFTGGLLGALHGQSIIPSKWKAVQDVEYLDSVAIQLLETSESRADSWSKKQQCDSVSLSKTNQDTFEINQIVFLETLGKGKIRTIDRQKAVTGGKYNLIIDVEFEIGQSCRFAKLLSIEEQKTDDLFSMAVQRVSEKVSSQDFDVTTAERIQKFKARLNDVEKAEFDEILRQVGREAKG